MSTQHPIGHTLVEGGRPEPVAVVGAACRFPGSANDPDTLWELLRNGVDATSEVPPDRWNADRFYNPDADIPGRMIIRRGGFLSHIDRFDAAFFGIAPREAATLDPQQRLMLELTWEALEDAGMPPERLAGSRTGVFVGGFTLDNLISQLGVLNRDGIGTHTAVGVSMTMIANRVSYTYDLRGPSLAIDTACSSSLVAIHYACMSLWNSESILAIAGGVNIAFKPEFLILLSKGGFLSPDGRSKSFDARADGYGRGEGGGVVVLKPLSAAFADRDPVYALILASGVNQDGRSEGITAPNIRSQVTLMRDVVRKAGIQPESVQYIEAHGTGTAIGDPVEARAIGTVFGRGRPVGERLWIGSIKSNIGHSEAAAGIASVLKAALALQYGEIPPSLHFETPNPAIPFDDLRLSVPRRLETWPAHAGPARAAVNGFGYGGTNAHLLMQQAPAEMARTVGPAEPAVDGDGPFFLPLSARSQAALQAYTTLYAEFCEGAGRSAALADICHGAGGHKGQHSHRLAIACRSRKQLCERLRAAARGEVPDGRPLEMGADRPVFVYTGVGPQWWAMGRQLFEQEPVYRTAIERCDSLFRRWASWSLIEELNRDEGSTRIGEPQIMQPANFALQVGLTEWLRSRGVEPAAVVGHSVGETVSAWASGSMPLEDAVRVSCLRSCIQQRAAGKGGMLAVALGEEEARTAIASYTEGVDIAAVNSPNSVTLAGEPVILARLRDDLTDQGVFARMLRVDVAYHSRHMDPLTDELVASLEGIRVTSPSIPLYSTVTGARVNGPVFDPSYWARNVREPVRLADVTSALADDGYCLFVQIGPHPVLQTSLQECLDARRVKGVILESLRRETDEPLALATLLGALYVHGSPLDWDRACPGSDRALRLPAYPWQREKYWQELPASLHDRTSGNDHPLLGNRQFEPGRVWQTLLNHTNNSFLPDHRVEGHVVFPGAAYIEMGLAVAHLTEGSQPCRIEDMRFAQPLLCDQGSAWPVRVTLDPDTGLFSISSPSGTGEETWTHHAGGRIGSAASEAADTGPGLTVAREQCGRELSAEVCYQQLRRRGLDYGPAFRGITRLWRGPDQALAHIIPAPAVAGSLDQYRFHPALLDAVFQCMIAALPNDFVEDRMYLPYSVSRTNLNRPVRGPVWAHARLRQRDTDRFIGDMTVFDEDGEVIADIVGFECRAVGNPARERDALLARCFYRYEWRLAAGGTLPGVEIPAPPNSSGTWVLLAPAGEIADTLCEQLRKLGRSCVRVEPGNPSNGGPEGRLCARPGEREDLSRVFDLILDEHGSDIEHIVYLWSLAGCDMEGGATEWSPDALVHGLLALVGEMADREWPVPPRLTVVTAAAQTVDGTHEAVSPSQTALWGFARVLMNEQPQWRCRLVDVSADAAAEIPGLLRILSTEGPEEEVACRAGTDWVHRLVRVNPKDLIPPVCSPAVQDTADGFQLEVPKPGVLGSLEFQSCPRRAPGPGEVEIEIAAVGINFKDVMKAMGILSDRVMAGTYNGRKLGFELSGRIVACGPEVTGFAVGDEVFGIVPDCFRSHLTTDSANLFLKPARLDLNQTASLFPFITAYYALVELAHLRRGESILIHSAASGTGLAAIMIARSLGAEVLATAGTPEKRQMLVDMGIECVMDSRSLEFAEAVRKYTGGRGVDVVLNALSGEALRKSLNVLAPYGRFVEMGKQDIDRGGRLDLAPFNENLSFLSMDVDRLFADRPEYCRTIVRRVLDAIEHAEFGPLPVTVHPAAEIADAFRLVAQGKHTGKIVVNMRKRPTVVLPQSRSLPVRADATYLITGGLSGFGLELARWLVRHGARHLILVSRSGASRPEAKRVLEEMRDQGARIMDLAADVTAGEQFRAQLDRARRDLPPLRGVIHGAMVLADGMIAGMGVEQFDRAFAPKAVGGWELHQYVRHEPLDFFLLLSSVSALYGNPGQGNYAAANAFLDGLAHRRRAEGMPGTSVNLGVLAEVGAVARDDSVRQMLSRQGLEGIRPVEATAMLEAILVADVPQMAAMLVDWPKWLHQNRELGASPRFCELRSEAEGKNGDRVGPGVAGDQAPQAAAETPRDALLGLAANVLGMDAGALDPNVPLKELGFDSLMATELRVAVSGHFGSDLPMVNLLRGPSVDDLYQLVTGAIEDAPHENPPPATPDAVPGAGELPGPGDNMGAETEDLAVRRGDHGDESVMQPTSWSATQRIFKTLTGVGTTACTRLTVEGLENVPLEGGVLIAFNHVHPLDTPLIFRVLPRRAAFLASDHLRARPVVNWILTHVGDAVWIARGYGDQQALACAADVVRAGGALCVAPEGEFTRSATLGRAFSGIAYLASWTGVPVLPLVVKGLDRPERYWRLGHRVPVHIKIAPAIPAPDGLLSSAELHAFTEEVMVTMARLLADPEPR